MKQLAHSPRRRTGAAMAEVDRLTGEVAGLARRTLRAVAAVAGTTAGRLVADLTRGGVAAGGELDETIGHTGRLLEQTDQRLVGTG